MARLGSTNTGDGMQPRADDVTCPTTTDPDETLVSEQGARDQVVAGISRTLESLKYRGFRYLWLGSLLGMGGFGMQSIARTVLVDDLTGSAFITGLVAMGFAPTMLIMSLFG